MPEAIITRVGFRALAGLGASATVGTAYITKVAFRAIATQFNVELENDFSIEPWKEITLKATADVDGVTQYIFTQREGTTPFTISSSSGSIGDKLTFTGPATIDGINLAFSVVGVHPTLGTSAPASVRIFVAPHSAIWGIKSDGSLEARRTMPIYGPPISGIAFHGSSSPYGIGATTGNSGRELVAANYGVTGYNDAIPGEYSWNAAAWMNAKPMLCTTATGKIPPSGGVVISKTSFDLPAGNALSTHLGTLKGVAGTMAWSSTNGGTWTFTRTAAGAEVILPPATPFYATQGVQHRSMWHVFAITKNDLNLSTNIDPPADNLQAMVQYINTDPSKYVVVGNWVNQATPAGDARNRILAGNSMNERDYGTRFVDLFKYFKSPQLWTYLGITPTATDLACQAAGVLPPSISSDPVSGGGIGQHLNDLGHKAWAKKVIDTLEGRTEDDNADEVTMIMPASGQKRDFAGDVYMEVDIPASFGATAVMFEVAHPDFCYANKDQVNGAPVWPAARVSGSTSRWRSTVPWKTAKSPRNQTVDMIEDYNYYIRPVYVVNGIRTKGNYIKCWPNNFNMTGTVPTTDAALNMTADMSSVAANRASYDKVYGYMNDPDGTPTLQIVTNAVTGKKMTQIGISHDHAGQEQDGGDQPNGNVNVRVQHQGVRGLVDGKKIFVGFSIMTPTSVLSTTNPGFPNPGPLYSEVAIMQLMGAIGNDFDRGLRIMLRAVTATTSSGLSDMKREYWHIADTDGHAGDPAVMFQIPMNRGQVMDLVFEFAVSSRPDLGYVRAWTRMPGQTDLVPYEFFGIAGNTTHEMALIPPGGAARVDAPQLYRGRSQVLHQGKMQMYHGQVKWGTSVEAVDPHSYPAVTNLLAETFEGGTDGAALSISNSLATTVTNSTGNTATFSSLYPASGALGLKITLGTTNTTVYEWPITASDVRTVLRMEAFRFSATGTFRIATWRTSSGNAGHLAMASTRALALVNAGGTTITTPVTSVSTTILAVDTLYDIEFAITPAADGAGILEYAIFARGGTTPIETKVISGTNVGTGLSIARFRLPTAANASVAQTIYMDNPTVRALATGWIGG